MSGEGSLYQRKSDGRWVGAVVYGHDTKGRQLRKTVTAKKRTDAVKKLRKLQENLTKGLPPPDDRLTVTGLFEGWLEQVVPSGFNLPQPPTSPHCSRPTSNRGSDGRDWSISSQTMCSTSSTRSSMKAFPSARYDTSEVFSCRCWIMQFVRERLFAMLRR